MFVPAKPLNAAAIRQYDTSLTTTSDIKATTGVYNQGPRDTGRSARLSMVPHESTLSLGVGETLTWRTIIIPCKVS